MRRQVWMAVAAIVASLLMLNCDSLLARRRAMRHPEPVASAEPAPEPPKPKPKPKPKKPKCVSLEEKCVAKADTRVPIGSHKITFQAPEGWTYAKQGEFSLADAPEGDVALGFVEAESNDPDKIGNAISALLDEMKVTGTKLPTFKPRLKKPQSTMDAGGAQVAIWEIDKAANGGADIKVGEEPGKLGVFVTTIDQVVIVGAAFMAKKADAERGAASGQAVTTLRSGT